LDTAAIDCTQLLRAWSNGDREALDQLIPVVQAELRRIARRYTRRERRGDSLQTTALVNEAYLRLIHVKNVEWKDRAHFFAISARMMRRILVDRARARGYQKRGGVAQMVDLDAAAILTPERPAELVVLDEALDNLSQFDARKARVVELRFFGGLDVNETAAVLGISTRTVLNDWRVAKMWLARACS
jgi:RNA polymerase sigma-70 factor, ECF subfamily